jgi:hypothetical protein
MVPLVSEATAVKVTLLMGKVMIWFDPALTTGDPGITIAAFTVIFATSVALLPEASVTVS